VKNGAVEEKMVDGKQAKLLAICPEYKEVQNTPQFQSLPSLTQVREDD